MTILYSLLGNQRFQKTEKSCPIVRTKRKTGPRCSRALLVQDALSSRRKLREATRLISRVKPYKCRRICSGKHSGPP